MQIEASTLSQYLQKVSFGGSVDNTALDFTDKGLRIKFFASNQSVGGLLLVKKEMFVDYQPIGLVGILQLSHLITFLQRLQKRVVSLAQEGENVQHLVFQSETLDGIFRTAPLRYIEKLAKLTLPTIDPLVSFTLEKPVLQEIVANFKAVKDSSFNFVLKEDQLSITCGKEYKFTQKIKLPKTSNKSLDFSVSDAFLHLASTSQNPLTLHVPEVTVPYLLAEEVGETFQYKTVLSVQVDKGE